MKTGFVERSLRGIADASDYAASAERLGLQAGLLQAVDSRVKLAGLFALVLASAASHELLPLAALMAGALALGLGSGIPLQRLAVWVWMPVFFFTGPIAAPAVFLTVNGLNRAEVLLLRAETAATFSALLVLTTPWPRVLRALRIFRVPTVFVVILGMTYRYIFVILQSALEMLESRRSRTVGAVSAAERRRIATSAAGVLLSKSVQLSSDVHLAMLSRGFRGEVRLLNDFQTRPADWVWLALFAVAAAAAFWVQR